MEDEERRIITRLDQRLKEKGIEEVVTMCPNCYHFLKGHLSIEVKTVYRKLRELGLGKKIAEKAVIFRHVRIGKRKRCSEISVTFSPESQTSWKEYSAVGWADVQV